MLFAGAAHGAETPSDSSQPATPAVAYLSPDQLPAFPAPPKRYAAPTGFAGHRWGELRAAFNKLPEQPAGIGAAWTEGTARELRMICSDAIYGGCGIDDYARAARLQVLDGGGFHVLSEYLIDTQGYKFPATGVLLHPVVYQFCANWDSNFKEVPKDFDRLNKFCGVRMLFETETRTQLRDLPEDHVTRYDLVFAELTAKYGRPANFTWRGHVLVEPVGTPGEPAARSDRRFSTWRWCPAPRDGLMTRCASSIVLTVDPDLGRGIVLFSTPALWQYASARETSEAQPDPLYTLLHALPFKYRTAWAQRKATHLQKIGADPQ